MSTETDPFPNLLRENIPLGNLSYLEEEGFLEFEKGRIWAEQKSKTLVISGDSSEKIQLASQKKNEGWQVYLVFNRRLNKKLRFALTGINLNFIEPEKVKTDYSLYIKPLMFAIVVSVLFLVYARYLNVFL